MENLELATTSAAAPLAPNKGQDCKRFGETSEAIFLGKACELGFHVSKPWGDSDPYDFVVNAGRGFQRVQIKSTSSCTQHRYMVHTHGESAYTKDEIDFLVAHIVPAKTWYILPVESFAPRCAVSFNPHGGRGAFERFREAWCLFTSTARNAWKRIPRICRSRELPIRCAVCPEGRCNTAPQEQSEASPLIRITEGPL